MNAINRTRGAVLQADAAFASRGGGLLLCFRFLCACARVRGESLLLFPCALKALYYKVLVAPYKPYFIGSSGRMGEQSTDATIGFSYSNGLKMRSHHSFEVLNG